MTVREEVYCPALDAFMKNGLWALPMTVLPVLACTNAMKHNRKCVWGFCLQLVGFGCANLLKLMSSLPFNTMI